MLRRFLKITIALIVFSSAVFCEDWYVCLGSFKKQELAQRRMDLFVDSDISAFISEAKSKDGDTLYRVLYFKPFDSYASAMTKRAELSRHSVIKKFGIDDLWCCKSDGPLLRTVEIVKEIPVEVEKEVIKEVPVEVIKEVPVEIEKEVIKEVPVEVVKEVIKEVPVEVIKEVPVEKEVVKEVIKEVPVEKEVEVIKEVPVEKEVVKEVIKEVPVEKEVEVVKEVPVEVVK
ncbi:MAG: SPOR domain-containing protein, partial [Treponema sp.]|nr:SPOR domain-containing protein [Treponema sp.]